VSGPAAYGPAAILENHVGDSQAAGDEKKNEQQRSAHLNRPPPRGDRATNRGPRLLENHQQPPSHRLTAVGVTFWEIGGDRLEVLEVDSGECGAHPVAAFTRGEKPAPDGVLEHMNGGVSVDVRGSHPWSGEARIDRSCTDTVSRIGHDVPSGSSVARRGTAGGAAS
jgi:hypothetical protein